MRSSAPSVASPLRCRSTGRAPRLQPPGSETTASPRRASSGPSTQKLARMRRTKASLPFWLPIWLFAGVIGAGTLTLSTRASLNGADISWVDALFTATSAVCVTGLGVVDTGTHFTRFGQSAILLLIQLGGLGIMTYTSLAVYLLGRRVSLTDRIAVGQSLMHDPSFHLGRFLLRVVLGTLAVEFTGALLLHLADPEGFPAFAALFHAVSAFCNAGFSLFPDNLMEIGRAHV